MARRSSDHVFYSTCMLLEACCVSNIGALGRPKLLRAKRPPIGTCGRMHHLISMRGVNPANSRLAEEIGLFTHLNEKMITMTCPFVNFGNKASTDFFTLKSRVRQYGHGNLQQSEYDRHEPRWKCMYYCRTVEQPSECFV